MRWIINFPNGKSVDIGGQPNGFLASVTAKVPTAKVNWYGLLNNPIADTDLMYQLVVDCAALVEQDIDELPPRPETDQDAAKFVDLFESQPDIAEQPAGDGFPTRLGETDPGSGSGQSDSTDGPPT